MLYKQEGKLLSKDEVLIMAYITGGCNTPPSPKTLNTSQAKNDKDDYSSGDSICMDQPLEVGTRFYLKLQNIETSFK